MDTELTANAIKAFLDLTDGLTSHDIVSMTGLTDGHAMQIFEIRDRLIRECNDDL